MRSTTILVWLAALWLGGCGADGTGGRPVVLRTELRADPEIAGTFTTQTGWQVRLTRAAVSLGALYYFDGEPAFVQRRRRPLGERLASYAGLSVARAHPGHYVAGSALGQMTTPASADLLSGVTALPVGNGVSGVYRSARLVLASPVGEPGRSLLGGDAVASVEGSASKDGQTVNFRLSASFADVARSVSGGQVDGCAFSESEVERDGLVTLVVKPHVWFDLVDFAGIAAGTASAPTIIAAGETPQIAFALGVAQLSAYHFSYAP